MTMNEGNSVSPGPQDFRIGDADRNAALTALGEHLSSGRLDLDEYGARSAQVANARTTGDLQALFADLPGPHPGVVAPAPPGYPQAFAQPAPPAPAVKSRAQQIAAGLTGVSGLIAVVLFFLLNDHWDHAWLVFLLIPLAYGIASAVWGPDWRGGRQRDRRRR